MLDTRPNNILVVRVIMCIKININYNLTLTESVAKGLKIPLIGIVFTDPCREYLYSIVDWPIHKKNLEKKNERIERGF